MGVPSTTGTVWFTVIAMIWGYTMAWIGAKGIHYVARVSLLINAIPFVMILVVSLKTSGGLRLRAAPPLPGSSAYLGFALLVQIVTGFLATAGAAGADFGMNSRHERDARLGGFVGIVLPVLFAGGLPLLSIAAAHNLHPHLQGYSFDAVIAAIGGILAGAMFFLYAIALVPGACFCAFIAGNSSSTMLPRVPRISSMMVGLTVSIILAATGVAANLVPFFQIVGASFAPICSAMLADHLLSGRKWAGPRQGINFAGYGAWAVGFVIGIVPFLPVPEAWKGYVQPAMVYSAAGGFATYTFPF